ncbi:hypothetical protein BZA70DRAFT_270681 [Myxozyma melibiosi]|uniref:Dienelactone hydrolase domain-containing protein n=1 Tax=Myxozyma melibiosi TaxID=54550 RepID=A0ABR1FBF5_9ASCO
MARFAPRGDNSRNPYLDNVPLDDTNDNIFLAESDDDDDDFFFNEPEKDGSPRKNRRTTWDPAGEFRTLPDSQERIYVSKPHWAEADATDDEQNGEHRETAKADAHGFSLLLLLTNGLGIDSLNNLLMADSYAREGYFVVMPDLFFGDPNAPIVQPPKSFGPTSLLSRVKSLAVSSATGFRTDMWVARHTEERTWPMLVQMIDEIVDIYRPRDISVVGYSFGGKYALKLLQLPIGSPDAKERSMSSTSSSSLEQTKSPTAATPLKQQSPVAETPNEESHGDESPTEDEQSAKLVPEEQADEQSQEQAEEQPMTPSKPTLEIEIPTTATTSLTSPSSSTVASPTAQPLSPAPFLSQPVVSSLTNPPWCSLITTGVIAHPSLAELRDFVSIKKPVLVLAVEDDPLFPPSLIQAAIKALGTHTAFYDVKLFDRKLPHGFAVKGDYPADNRLVAENQALAHRDIVSWLKSFVE